MKVGDLLRNVATGELAIVLSTFTKFFQDKDAYDCDYDCGVADTAIRIKWIENGHERTFRRSNLINLYNWEVISESN